MTLVIWRQRDCVGTLQLSYSLLSLLLLCRFSYSLQAMKEGALGGYPNNSKNAGVLPGSIKLCDPRTFFIARLPNLAGR